MIDDPCCFVQPACFLHRCESHVALSPSAQAGRSRVGLEKHGVATGEPGEFEIACDQPAGIQEAARSPELVALVEGLVENDFGRRAGRMKAGRMAAVNLQGLQVP